LSAKFGLLELDDELPYYNKTLVNAKKVVKEQWAKKVLSQLRSKKIDIDGKNEFIFYAGNDYFLPLEKKIKNASKRFNLPFGKLLQQIKEKLDA
jgi:hypothetical protein